MNSLKISRDNSNYQGNRLKLQSQPYGIVCLQMELNLSVKLELILLKRKLHFTHPTTLPPFRQTQWHVSLLFQGDQFCKLESICWEIQYNFQYIGRGWEDILFEERQTLVSGESIGLGTDNVVQCKFPSQVPRSLHLVISHNYCSFLPPKVRSHAKFRSVSTSTFNIGRP